MDPLLVAGIVGFMAIGIVGVFGSFCRVVSLDAQGLKLASPFWRRSVKWSEVRGRVEQYDGLGFWVFLTAPVRRRFLIVPFVWAICVPKSENGQRLASELEKYIDVVRIKNLGGLIRSRR